MFYEQIPYELTEAELTEHLIQLLMSLTPTSKTCNCYMCYFIILRYGMNLFMDDFYARSK